VIVCDVSLSNWESRLEYWMSFLRCKSSLVIDRYHPHHFDHSSSSSSSSSSTINRNNHQSERDHHHQSITNDNDDNRVVFTAILIGTHIDQVGPRSSSTNISQQRMSHRFSTKIQELERRQEHRHIKLINGGVLDLSHQSSSTEQQQERRASSSSWRDIGRLVSRLISIGDSMYSSSRSLVPSSYKLVFDWIQRHRCSIIENHNNNNNSRSMIDDDHDEYSITSTSTSSSDRCLDVSVSRSSSTSRSAPMMTIGRMMIELSIIDQQQPHDDGSLQHQEPRRATPTFEGEKKKIDKQRLVWILRQLHGFGEVMFMPPRPQYPLDDDDDESSIDDDHDDGHGSSRYHHHHDDDRQPMVHHHRLPATNQQQQQEEEVSDSEPVVLSFNWLLCRIGEMFDEPDLLDDDDRSRDRHPTDHHHQQRQEWIDHARSLKHRTQGIWSTTDLAELWNLSPFDPIDHDDQQSTDRESTSLTMIESLAMILERMMMCYRLDAPRSSSSSSSFVFPLLLPMIDDDQRRSLMLQVKQQAREVMMSRWIRSRRAGGGALPPGAFGTFQVYWINLLRDARDLSSNATSSSSSSSSISSSSRHHLHHHQQVNDDHQLDDDEIDWWNVKLSMYLNEVHMFLNGELVMIASFHNPSLTVDRDPLHINTTSTTGPLDSMINVMFISNTNIALPHHHQPTTTTTTTRSINKYREVVRSVIESIDQALIDCQSQSSHQSSSSSNKKSNNKMKMIEEGIPCIECVRSQWSSSSRISVCEIFTLDDCRSGSARNESHFCYRTSRSIPFRSLIGIELDIGVDRSNRLMASFESFSSTLKSNLSSSLNQWQHQHQSINTHPLDINIESILIESHLNSTSSTPNSMSTTAIDTNQRVEALVCLNHNHPVEWNASTFEASSSRSSTDRHTNQPPTTPIPPTSLDSLLQSFDLAIDQTLSVLSHISLIQRSIGRRDYIISISLIDGRGRRYRVEIQVIPVLQSRGPYLQLCDQGLLEPLDSSIVPASTTSHNQQQ